MAIELPWRASVQPAVCIFRGAATGRVYRESFTGEKVEVVGDFGWGHPGQGCIDLARIILATAIGDDLVALALAKPFAHTTLVLVPEGEPWSMSDTIVRAVAASFVTREQPNRVLTSSAKRTTSEAECTTIWGTS